MISFLFVVVFAAEELNTVNQQLEDELQDIKTDLNEIKQDIEYQWSSLGPSLVQALESLSSKVQNDNSKIKDSTSKLLNTKDQNILKAFDSEILNKNHLIDENLNRIYKNLQKGSQYQRLSKVLDIYTRRQAVPDKDLALVTQLLETQAGKIQQQISKTYGFEWLYLVLAAIGLGVVLVWRALYNAQKRHIL
mmetsp:Transcript_2093/g.3345  ORF Transcript_2093/g.3345 Transcript_2093/m.3345 type:complete len:192 (-) Transcript_2093:389-964(-)